MKKRDPSTAEELLGNLQVARANFRRLRENVHWLERTIAGVEKNLDQVKESAKPTADRSAPKRRKPGKKS